MGPSRQASLTFGGFHGQRERPQPPTGEEVRSARSLSQLGQMETSACLYEYKSFIVLSQKSIREEGVAGDIPCTYDSLDFSESGQEAIIHTTSYIFGRA